MKTKIFAFAKIAVTALLFLYIFKDIDFKQFGFTMKNARLDILIFGFLAIWVAHYICIYRWRMLMRPLMPVLSMARLFGIYCIGLFFNLTLPTVVGGDVVKMYYAGRPSKLYAQSFAATFLDRDAGMLAMLIIACTAILIHPVVVPGIPVSLIIWSVLAAFVAGNIAIFAPYFHRRLISLLHRLHMAKIAAKIDMISNAFQVMGKHPLLLLGSLLISFVNQLLVIAVYVDYGDRTSAPRVAALVSGLCAGHHADFNDSDQPEWNGIAGSCLYEPFWGHRRRPRILCRARPAFLDCDYSLFPSRRDCVHIFAQPK